MSIVCEGVLIPCLCFVRLSLSGEHWHTLAYDNGHPDNPWVHSPISSLSSLFLLLRLRGKEKKNRNATSMMMRATAPLFFPSLSLFFPFLYLSCAPCCLPWGRSHGAYITLVRCFFPSGCCFVITAADRLIRVLLRSFIHRNKGKRLQTAASSDKCHDPFIIVPCLRLLCLSALSLLFLRCLRFTRSCLVICS